MSSAVELGHAVHREMLRLASSATSATAGLRLFGVGNEPINRRLSELEPLARRSVHASSPVLRFDPSGRTYRLTRRSQARGIRTQSVVGTSVPESFPLLSSFIPASQVGPAVIRMLLIDDRAALLEGPTSPEGQDTAWLVTRPAVLDLARAYWAALVSESVPVLADPTHPPLSARQRDVARALCRGETDAAIGRRLRVSVRTVERDVATILDLLGATGRTDGALRMMGAWSRDPGPRRDPGS